MRALFVAFALVLACLVAPRAALAGPTASIAEPGPIILDASGVGRFTVKNVGDAPLHVNTLYARTNERDPRIPGTVTATFEPAPPGSGGGGTKADLAPGESRTVSVKWSREGARLTQLFGHVVVESTDVAAPQRAIGVIGAAKGAGGLLRAHVGTWLVALPLLGALLIVPLRASRRVDEKIARWIALVVVGLQAALLLWAIRAFDPAVTRLDGNDGFQLVERARLFGAVEWHLGVDGTALPMLAALTAAAFAGVLASFRLERHHELYFVSYLVLLACGTGALLALDAMLLVVFAAAAAIPAWVLSARFGGARARTAATKAALLSAVSLASLLLLVLALRRSSDATFLVDGTRAQTFSIAELARGEWLARSHGGLMLFGMPFVKGAVVALFVAAAAPLAIAPLHGGLADVYAEAPAGASMVIGAAGSLLGAHLLLRLGVRVLPEGLRWGAPALAALGAASIVWGALAALGEDDLRRAVAHLSVAHGGLVLLGLASGTPQGLAGAIAQATARAVVIAMLLGVAGALHERLRARALDRLGGLAADMPGLAGLAAIAFLGAAAAPGTLSFVSALLAMTGSFPVHRVATAVAGAGLVLLAWAAASRYRRIFLGTIDEAWRRSDDLEPFGGKFPEARRREAWLLGGLAIVLVVFGLAPRPLLALSRGTLVDLDAKLNVERVQ